MAGATEGATREQGVAADFVRRFAEVWRHPTPERLNELVCSDVEFVQPTEPTLRGHAKAAAFWRRFFAVVSGARAEVLNWASRDGVVFIELRMSGTVGGRPISWNLTDRIRLEGDKVAQRVAYFNPFPLFVAVALRPWVLWAWWRSHRS